MKVHIYRKEKACKQLIISYLQACDSVGIRTQDPQLRRLLLYPTELRNHRFKGAKLQQIAEYSNYTRGANVKVSCTSPVRTLWTVTCSLP